VRRLLAPMQRVSEAEGKPRAGAFDAAALPFIGGAVGVFGYELAEQLEVLRFSGKDDLGLPDLVLLLVDRLIALDHRSGRLFASALGFASDAAASRAHAEASLAELMRELGELGRVAAKPCAAGASGEGEESGSRSAAERLGSSSSPPVPRSSLVDATGYAERVREAQERIAAGDVYQVCLTQRLELSYVGDGWRLYRTLCRINPAPFAAFLELPEVTIAASSPERFLRLDAQRRVESRPIKGTRPRGKDPVEDAALRKALLCSPKDRAENLMIVDLVRNDLGRVCETGSIVVPELFSVESYATVFQLVSTIQGRLRGECDGIDLLCAAFPPGSMTGAPKLAALRILDGLEPVRRGLYAGALGYLDVRGGLDLAVAIRTVWLTAGRAVLHVGGGVVADSDPEAEYRESMDKAQALLEALRLS